MADEDKVDKNKAVLSVEIKDLIDMVSRSKNSLSLGSIENHPFLVEAEELKKAWFRHLLVSLEKLNDIVEDIRRSDLPEVKKELKEELNKIERDLKEDLAKIETSFKTELTKIEKVAEKFDDKLVKANEAFDKYKTDIINPLNDKVTVVVTKMSLIGMLAGAVGSIIFLIIKELFKIL